MNAPMKAPADRDDLLARMHELVECLEMGDSVRFEARFASLLQAREQGIFVSVAKLTRNLHEAVRELKFDDALANAAGRDIPDACSRLEYVVKVTEDAAHHTLDLVEQCQRVTQEIALRAHDLDGACRNAQAYAGSPYAVPGLVIGVDEVREQITLGTVTLREKLSQLAQAQEYQDLAGQVIRRVTQIVRSVENALLDVLRASGAHLGSRVDGAAPPPANGLYGPAVPGSTPAAVSQDDADSLLAELGF